MPFGIAAAKTQRSGTSCRPGVELVPRTISPFLGLALVAVGNELDWLVISPSKASERRQKPTSINRKVTGGLVFLGVAITLASCGGSGTLSKFTEFTIPTANSGPGPIVTGPDGNLWFLEGNAGANKIAKISVNGTITEYPLPVGTSFPTALVNGQDGNLWYVDEATHLGRVTTSGVVTNFLAPVSSSLTVGSDGNLWVASFNGSVIDVYTTAGAFIHSYAANTSPSSLQLEGITSGPDGNLWFATFSGGNVVKMTTVGVTTTFNLSATITNTMRGITSGSDGNLWIAGEGNNLIARVSTSGALTTFVLPTANSGPSGITQSTDGNFWFTENAGNRIGTITPAGVITEFTIPTAGAAATGISAGPDGNIWFTESGSNKIGRFTP